MKIADHDVKPGPLSRCQICGSANLRLIVDLGHQPLCDALVTHEGLHQPETSYPLRLNQCEECSLAQLDYVVSGLEVYPSTYPYRAGISWPVVAAHKQMAGNLVQRFGKGLCVDIGSNDGTLLMEFHKLGCEVMGIEPTDIADISRASKVPTVKAFFTEAVALGVKANCGHANIVTMTNVFAHMADLGEVMRGVSTILANDGVLVIENHYLLDILEGNQFDSIYHEHIRTYTLKSLQVLFAQYGMEVFDVERVARYGGNIRVYVGRKGNFDIDGRVMHFLHKERESGIYMGEVWYDFWCRILDCRDQFMEYAIGREIVGCSAPGRASTLLNFFGVTRETMPYTGEIDGSLKIGKYIPGCHIPIVSNRRLVDENPEHIVLLAWHYGNEIEARLRKEGVRGDLILPLPEFEVRSQSIGIAA